MIRLIVLVATVGCLVACPDREKTDRRQRLSVLSQVSVTDRSRPTDRIKGATEEVIAGWAVKKLRGAAEVRLVDTPGEGVYRLRIELGVGPRGDEQVALVSARGEVPGDMERPMLQASVAQTLDEKSPAGLRKAVGTVMADLLFQVRLVVADEKLLARTLGREKDAQRLAAAVEIAAVRRARVTVPALVKLLKHEDLRVADRAIGALVAIGDPRAVRALTRLAKFSDTEKMAKIIDGIGSLGGKEAREWLEFVASGHEDADIRNLAREALERMKVSSGKSGS